MRLMKCAAAAALLGVVVVCSTSVGAATVKIRAVNFGGENLPKALVIVRSLEDPRPEVLRALTGPDGLVPDVEVPPGPYEAIAAYPYGIWQTAVQDFMVGAEPVTLELQLGIDFDQRIRIDVIDWHVKVVDARGRPVANAWVTGRSMDAATGVSVAKTDSHGTATVSIPIDNAWITVLYKGRSSSQSLQPDPHVVDCQNDCFLRTKAKLKALPRTLTLTVP